MTRLSVIMASYDDAPYIKTAIDAILNQTFKDFELIIINDASPDNTDAIVKDYLKQDQRIKYLVNEKNLGLVKSANRGAIHAQGEFIYYASSDDRVEPHFFETYLRVFKTHQDLVICIANPGFFYDGLEKSFIKEMIPQEKEGRFFSPEELLSLCRKRDFVVWGCTAMIKKEEVIQRGFLQNANYSADFILNNSIALEKGAYYIPVAFSFMRLFPSQKIRGMVREKKLQEIENLLQCLKKNPPLLKLMIRSTLLARSINYRLFTLFLKKRHWDIALPMFYYKFQRLLRKLCI